MAEHEDKKGEELEKNIDNSENNNNQDDTKVIDYGGLRIRYNGIFFDKKLRKNI